MKNKNLKMIIYIGVFILFTFCSFLGLTNPLNNIPKSFKILGMLLILGSFIMMVVVYYFLLKKNDKIEIKFLIIGFVIGIIYLAGIPMMKGTDEIPHFFRIYQISNGNILTTDETKIEIPENLFKYADPRDSSFYRKSVIFEKNSKNLISIDGNVAARTYPPTQYVPQIAGILVAKVLNLGPFFTLYLVRLFNLLGFLAICYYAIKRLPVKRELVSILYLSPAMLSLVSTMSGDAFLNACTLLYISIILDIYVNNKKLLFKDSLLLLILAIVIATIKIVYTPIILLILLINKNNYKLKIKNTNISKKVYVILLFLVSVICCVGWQKLISNNVVGTSVANNQMSFILANPIRYLFIFASTFLKNAYYYISNLLVGNEMCLTMTNVNSMLVLMYLALFIVSYFYDNKNIKLNNKVKIFIWFIFLCILGAIATTMYLNWTFLFDGVGGYNIIGVQSRYFIILVPILSLTLPVVKKKLKNVNLLMNLCLYLNIIISVDVIISLVINYSNLL